MVCSPRRRRRWIAVQRRRRCGCPPAPSNRKTESNLHRTGRRREVHCAVLIPGMAPVGLTAIPVSAGDASSRSIDYRPMIMVARNVGDLGRADVEREVPDANRGAAHIAWMSAQQRGELVVRDAL